MSRYDDDAYMYYAKLKQHLKLNSCESYSEAVLKRSFSCKKSMYFPSVGVKAYLIYVLFRRESKVVFLCES